MRMIDLKLLWRDWRGGQLNLVVSALVLAVMVVTAVSLFADRVERGLNQQISSFLAADLAVSGGIEINDEYRQQAANVGLEVAETVRFRSMVFAGERNHLAAVKAVDQAYPLRGDMELSATLAAEQVIKLARGPEPGEAWVEARLLNLLDIAIGDTVEVGYVKLKVTHLIVNEPDRGTGFSGTGARLMMSTQDLAASQLIRPGGRYSYRLLMRGDASAIQAYSDWFEQQQETADADSVPHYRLLTPENAEEQLSEALARGRAFLLLSGTIGVLLAGLAMALASQRYASRLTDQVALMKAWGQSATAIRRSQFFRLFVIAAVATTVGVALGWLAHYLLLEVVRGVLNVVLPLPGWRPWLVATITGFVCVLGFALPALWHLPRIEPLRVLRRDLPDTLMGQGRRLLIGIGALLLLAYWYSGSLVVAALFLAALFALFAVCALIAMQILRLVRGFGSWRGSYTRLGLANLWRRRGQTLVQLVGFSTTLMLLLVVTGMRTNLIAEWEAQLPDNTPSHFLFNVSTPQLEPIKALLDGHGVTTTDWYPMVRGRLVAINGEAISRERMARSDGLSREVNFTQTDALPEGNAIVSGEWWSGIDTITAPRAEFSLEQEVATEIGIVLGDEVEFSIGGLRFSAKVTSIRSVNWQSMTPNFYVVFYPGLLDKYSPNWITAVRGGDGSTHSREALTHQAPFVQSMVKQFPTAVVLELRDVIERIRDVITRVTQGLELILFAVLACGGLVLFAAIGVSFDERLRENAILRTLGSSRRIIVGALTVEFATLGLIAGLIAACGAEIVLYFVQTNLFDLSPQWHWNLWLLGVVSGVGLITTLGLLRSRPIISTPPLESLRQLA